MARSNCGRPAASRPGLAMSALALAGLAVAGAPDAPDTAQAADALHLAGAPGGEGCAADNLSRISDPSSSERHEGEITPEQAAEHQQKLEEELGSVRGPQMAPSSPIPVVVHVISAEDGEGDVSQERVEQQIQVLNDAFEGSFASGDEATDTGFRFELADTTRHTNDEWFQDFSSDRDSIRAELHQGGPETLNVYTADLGSGVLGFSTFPQDIEADPEQDGVVVSYDTLPDGGRDRFDIGHTTTHEVGHWLGLFHTFQNGCETPGDYVDDTPYEREAATGCPASRNTCPDRPGEDPVNNFMNYSDDACMTHFTPGQAERMAQHWNAFREPQV
nr:zinc metalloprotease [Nocardiopsis salina]